MIRIFHSLRNGSNIIINNQIKSLPSSKGFRTLTTITNNIGTNNNINYNHSNNNISNNSSNNNNKNNNNNKFKLLNKNENFDKKEFFLTNTTINAKTIQVKAEDIREKLIENINEANKFLEIETEPINMEGLRSFKIIKIDSKFLKQTSKQNSNSKKILKLVIDNIEHNVLIEGNPTIKHLTTPSVLLEFGLINKLPTKPTTTMPSPINTSKQSKKLENYIAYDTESNRLPNSLLVNDFNYDKIILNQHSYAMDTDTISVQQILKQLCQQHSIGNELNEIDFKNCLEEYERELAIASPKTLISIKIEKDFYKRILNHLKDCFEEYEKKLALEKKKNNNILDSDNNNNNNNNYKELEEEVEMEEKKNQVDINLKRVADLSEPHKWYPEARRFKRHIILHVGPTNSGKTYNALKRLMESESGVYCGPLRLLAHEIYDKMVENGLDTSLMTGQLRINNPNSTHSSCTIEMVSTDKMVEVAVIDEFQLMSDITRGQSWTRAILGIPAVELHLCGDNTSIELVKRMCEITGDILTINNYERLSTLVVDETPITTLESIKKGDCLICFKKKDILFYKNFLEGQGLKCAIVYGSLPPTTRVKQAKLFNTDENIDVLIATDAIGMGLNLNIGRVIFLTLKKFDGESLRELYASEVKQIAGRAGRFGTKYPIGTVTTLTTKGLEKIRKDWESPNIISDRAGLFPTPEQIERFSQLPQCENLTFSQILSEFLENTNIDKHYFLSNFDEFISIAKITDLSPMSIKDKFIFAQCPIGNTKNESSVSHYSSYANNYSNDKKVHLLFDIDKIETAEQKFLKSRENKRFSEFLETLESFYRITDIYLWLSNYFPNHFVEVKKAIELSDIITSKISLVLEQQIQRKKKDIKFKKFSRPNKIKDKNNNK
ncbi:hypothetical protein ACTFIU_004952 [Dictyostelium citrinum]